MLEGSIRWLRLEAVQGVDVMDVDGVAKKWNHHHETYTVCVMKPSGRAPAAEWLYRRRTHKMGIGGTMLMEPGEFHTNTRPAPPADFSVVLIERERFFEMLAYARGYFGLAPALRRPQLYAPDVLGKMHGVLSGLATRDPERMADELLEFVNLLCERDVFEQSVGASKAAVGPDYVRRALDFIQERWNEPYQLTELVRSLGVPASTLSHSFRRKVGLGLRQYRKRVRLEHSRRLLVQRSRTIVDIAAECGYFEPATFCRDFKELFGVAPSEYR
jgi:AraC-like DNA-binding protein